MGLTNDEYTRGAQCMKILWMDKHKPEHFDQNSLVQEMIDNNPQVIGLAKDYFGEPFEIPFDGSPADVLIERTRQAIEQGHKIILNACFEYEENQALIDILRIDQEGMHIVDVRTSLHIKENYYHDLAFQYYVVNGAGNKVASASVMHLNEKYERQGDLDIRQLFTVKNLTADVEDMQIDIYFNIKQILEMRDGEDSENEPKVYINTMCCKPYECGYRGWCWRRIPRPSIFDLADLSWDAAFTANARGIITLQQALEKVKMNDFQRVQAQSYVDGQKTMIDAQAVSAFVKANEGDLCFLDLEAPRHVVPRFDNTNPYGRVPWGFSLAAVDGSEIGGFAGENGEDVRADLASALVDLVPAGAKVMVFDAPTIDGVLRNLAVVSPNKSDALDDIRGRLVDMETIFAAGSYYVPYMLASHSFDSVLGALFHGEPEAQADDPTARAAALSKIWGKLVEAAN